MAMTEPLFKPRYHGNGFIQVYLTPHTRLHIWEPSLAEYNRVVNAQIHDHRFWLESRIYMGRLHHITYEVRYDSTYGRWDMHEVVPATQNKDGHEPKFISRCRVELVNHQSFGPGDTYTFGGPGLYHETYALERTVTIMTKVRQDKDYHARILSPHGQEPDHAFAGAKPPEEKLRGIVAQTLAELGVIAGNPQ